MEPYHNIRRTSKVEAYGTEADAITVKFKNGEVYQYTYTSAGRQHVERMKQLAQAGWGLGSYIEEVAELGYARQLA